jgi:hypothetical protein
VEAAPVEKKHRITKFSPAVNAPPPAKSDRERERERPVERNGDAPTIPEKVREFSLNFPKNFSDFYRTSTE